MSDSEGDLSADSLHLSDASSEGEDEIGMWAWVMDQMQSCINNNFNEASSASKDELLKFLEVELRLRFYDITPDFFYDKRNIAEYAAAARVMGLARYRAILTALGKPSGLSDESTST
ncbi:unnamed protein product [Phytophthora fragariaefolia]|uniref:Unnamed protein product n=1 Tax=Phytophthora fragariaefolia TaxID=1490495 RepID=A0A9W6Y146_9STRA|nr:unnamed protein product [Phytophthora fragariaefolia]